MKSLVVLFLILCLMFNPINANANRFMGDAKEMLKQQKQNTEDYINILLSNDVNLVLNNIYGVSSSLNESSLKFSEGIAQIEKKFSRVTSTSVFEGDDLDNLINKLVTDYTILNRRLFDYSWIPATSAGFQDEFLNIAGQMIEGLKYQCTVGKNDIGFDPTTKVSPPPPKFAYSFFVSASTEGNIDNGFQYQQYNYTLSKDIVNIQNYSSYALAYSTSYLVGVNGASTLAWAAAGVTAAVVVAIAMVSYFHGSKKRFKMMKEYHEAELYKFYNSLTTEDVSKMYKERCKDISKSLDDALVRLTNISKGGVSAQKELERYYLEKEKYALVQSDIKELVNTTLQIEKLIAKKANEDSIATLRAKAEELEEKIDRSNLIGMVAHLIVDTYGIKSKEVHKKFQSVNYKKIFVEKGKALKRIQALIEMRNSNSLKTLEKEKSGFKEYLNFRAEFLSLLDETFQYVWGKKNKAVVQRKVTVFYDKISQLKLKYLHVEEFKALYDSAVWLNSFFLREL